MTGWAPKITGSKDSPEDRTVLQQLSAGEIPALIVRGFYAAKDCKRIASQTTNFSKHVHGQTHLKKVGIFLSAYQNDRDGYFEDAEKSNGELDEMLAGRDPTGDMHAQIRKISDLDVSTAREGGRSYSKGIIRLWETGDSGPLHRDNASFEAPGYQVARYENQLSCVLCLQEPEDGGELVIYRQGWERHDERFREIGFGYSRQVLKTGAGTTVTPKEGDMVVFNPNHYHEILPVAGTRRRVTFGNFFGYGGSGNLGESWS